MTLHLNAFQTAALETYSNGEFSYLASVPFPEFETSPARCGDTFCILFSTNSAPPRAVTHAATPYCDSPALPRQSTRSSTHCTTPGMKHHLSRATGRRQDKGRHRPGHKRPPGAKGGSRGRYARPPRSRRKRRLCTCRPPAACPSDLHEEDEGRPRCTPSTKSQHPHHRQASSLLQTRPIHAPLIISSGSRPAFGRTAPNPSISVQQTHARTMGNMFPKMGKE